MKIKCSLSADSVGEAIKKLEAYRKRLESAGAEIASRLAQLGYQTAYLVMNGHIYSGETISSLEVEEIEPTKFVLKASSEALLFFEFGAGVNGGGHPLNGELKMGPGTYPNGKGHWNDPNGWWYETDDPNLSIRTSKKTGKMYAHSNGNPPHMPFYLASREMRDELLRVAKEVLQVD